MRDGESEIPTSDVLTREQMTSLLRDDASRVLRASEQFEAEAKTYEHKTKRMHYISDEMHEASFREYLPPLEAAETAALRVAGAATRNAFAVRAQLAETMAISDAEMAAAAQRQTMIAADVARLPLPRLAEDVRMAIMRNDRPAMYLYARLLGEKVKADDPRQGMPDVVEARSQLTRMTMQIRETLRDTSFDDLRQGVDSVLRAAGEIEGRAHKRRRAATVATTWDGRLKVAWPSRAAS